MPTGICVRHPRYTGLFFTRLSFALMLASPSAWCLCIFWWLLMERRIRREERYLQAKFGSAYDLYAENTAAYPNTVHLGAILFTLVGQTIAFRGLPPSGSAGRRHKPIVCPTETPLSEQYCT
jgi:protein-S-isoprenylcysteine O-methyltransferase Ste14